jgi:hypothetical protein
MKERKMITLNKKLCAVTLGLALLLAVGSTANAQSRFGGSMSKKEKAAYIGGGAAAGALIGGLLGGKKGAVIGGLVGAGGGTGYVYLRGRQEEERYYGYRGYRADNYRGYYSRANDYRDYRFSGNRARCNTGFRR